MKNQTRSIRGRWPVASGRGVGVSCRVSRSRDARRSSFGFTLVELLVTITIIGILAGMVLGVLRSARETGRESATKATIAKLNNIIMARYESYLTRRAPVDLRTTASGGTMSAFGIAQDRLYAIRDIMRMEMPDRADDVNGGPIELLNSKRKISSLPLQNIYQSYISKEKTGTGILNGAAELLYMIVSITSPESMEQFHQSEIGDTNNNGLPEFLDGWGRPIFFLRWAPAFSNWAGLASKPQIMPSDIQTGNPDTDHDPFDPRHTESAYQLFPLIYSAGPDGKLGLNVGSGYSFSAANGKTFSNSDFPQIGQLSDKDGSNTDYLDNITNHQ